MLKEFYVRLKKAFSTLANPQPWLREALGVEETHAGVEVTPEGALACAAVAACCRLLSESVGSLPLFVFRRTETDKAKDTNHPNYRLLHDAPNDYQSSYTWRAQAMLHVLLHGNSYSFIERDGKGVRALWPLTPENVTVMVKDGAIQFEYWRDADKRRYRFDEILHLKGPSTNGITGLSIIAMARQGIGLAMAQDQHGASLFKNQGRPGLALIVPEMLREEQEKTLRESFEKTYSGAKNAGKSMVLTGGMKVEKLTFTNEDAQFLQSRQFSVQEIARWFRVSPTLIGDLSRSTYSNSEQEQLAFMQHSLRPWLVNFESEINRRLFADSDHFAEFDLSAIARGDLATRYESYSKGLAAGFLTVADVRRWENLPELPGTDVLRAPANTVPAGGGNAA